MIRKLLSVVYSLAFAALVVFVGTIIWQETFGHLIHVFSEHHEVRQTVAELEQSLAEPSDTLAELLGEGEQVRHYLGSRVLDEVRLEGHFHHIDLSVVPDQRSACVACHGDLPHSQEPERRAFWNMHAYTIGCETCHVRLEGRSGWSWYDRATGELIASPEVGVSPAPYTAKLIPLERLDGELQRVDSQARLEAAAAFEATSAGLTEEQQEAGLEPLHEHLAEQARTCPDCHVEDSDLPLEVLGYPPDRIHEIVGTEAVRMLEDYGTFHVFDIDKVLPRPE